ncbi:DP13A protein, partial [Polypterus senegalus]
MWRLERRTALYRQAANNIGGIGMGDPTPPHMATKLQAMDVYMYTRSLLGVFEEDAAAISSYSHQLHHAMQRIYDAQNELSAATHLTSKLLKEYDTRRFPLGSDDEVMSSTLLQFSKVIDELSSCHAVLSTQLADAMMFPITQFKERDLKEILTLKEVFQISSNDHDVAINRYSRLSKRRENEKISFFKLGSENLTQQWEDFLTNIGTSVQNVRREMESEIEIMQQTIQDLEEASDPLYPPDPDLNKIPVNRNLTRKSGYLNARKTVILQAESKKDCEEWISTINNISKRIYLSENPEFDFVLVKQLLMECKVKPMTCIVRECQLRHYSYVVIWLSGSDPHC